METSAPTLTLAAGDHTLVFRLVDGPDADVRWCQVSLLVSGQEEPLGAEALHVLARRIASVLIERPTERRWMFTLSGRYSSLYGVCRPVGWTLLLQDGHAVAIAELRLSSEEAARWLVKLEALRRERDDEGRDHRSPEHGTSRPKTVFIGPPLAGKATCVVALARVLGGKIQERNLTRDDHPFGRERAMGFSVSNNRFRGECWTIRGTPWLSASWDELLAEAQSVVLVIDGHAQREEANAQAIAQVANRQPSFPRGRIVLTKSDIVGLKEAWRQRDRLLSRTPTLAAWPTYQVGRPSRPVAAPRGARARAPDAARGRWRTLRARPSPAHEHEQTSAALALQPGRLLVRGDSKHAGRAPRSPDERLRGGAAGARFFEGDLRGNMRGYFRALGEGEESVLFGNYAQGTGEVGWYGGVSLGDLAVGVGAPYPR